MKKTKKDLTKLMDKYWELMARENYPKTPKITQELDVLEKEIKELL